MSDMGRDTRTTVRWADDELDWLERRAAAEGHGRVGTSLRRMVQAGMRAEERLRVEAARAQGAGQATAAEQREALRARGERQQQPDLMAALEKSLRRPEGQAGEDSAAAAAEVQGAAASAPRPEAAASRGPRVKLEVVVAVHLQGGTRVIAGLQPPAAIMRARKAISEGRVTVSGRGPHEVAPGILVGAGEVWVDGVSVTASWR